MMCLREAQAHAWPLPSPTDMSTSIIIHPCCISSAASGVMLVQRAQCALIRRWSCSHMHKHVMLGWDACLCRMLKNSFLLQQNKHEGGLHWLFQLLYCLCRVMPISLRAEQVATMTVHLKHHLDASCQLFHPQGPQTFCLQSEQSDDQCMKRRKQFMPQRSPYI